MNKFFVGLLVFMGVIYFIVGCLFINHLKRPLETIQPGDFVYCQMKDEVVGDYWIGRVQYTSEDGFVLRGGHVPLIPMGDEYGLHEPFKDWLMFNKVDCYKPLYD